MATEVELVLDARARLGEGAIWDANRRRLYWVDIEQHHLHVYDPSASRHDTHDIGQMIGTVVPRASGGVAVALHHGLGAYDLEKRQLTVFCDPNAHNPNIRFNDGKCDPGGRFWAGTLAMHKDQGKPIGALFRLDADHSVHKIADGIVCSNGIVWTKDRRTMFYIDTLTLRIDAFDYDDATGQVSNRRPAVHIPKGWGYPDGMTIDRDDRLWVAFWDGACVRCFDAATGRAERQIDLPVPRVTSCAFGGPNLDELYITSAWTGLSDAQRAAAPLSGGLFLARPGVTGVPASEFNG